MTVQQALMSRILADAECIEPPARDGVVLVNGADLKPTPVSWLWQNWLSLGKLALLAGEPGQGKTTMAMAFAAIVTSGGRWPDGSSCEAGNVLIWSGEDDSADTLLPRILASGGDPRRCYFIRGTRRDGEERSFDPARDICDLRSEADRVGGVKLIVVDPIVSAVTGDSHKNTETRRDLQPLVNLAAGLHSALLGITHLSKGRPSRDPTSRVLGSVAFVAVARIVLVAAKVKGDDGEDRRILARGKSNIGPDDGGYIFSVRQSEPIPGIQASHIAWGEPVQGTARELLGEPQGEDTENDLSGSAADSAVRFLRTVLAGGTIPSKSVQAQAREAGIAPRTLRRAKDSLGVMVTKGADCWYWSLREKPRPWSTLETAPIGQGVHARSDGHLEVVGQLAQSSSLGHVGQVGQVEQAVSSDADFNLRVT